MSDGEKRNNSRIIIGALVVIFIIIQFIPVSRTNPPVKAEIPAPANVKPILERACYDCHSNETDWPWYSHVAPVSWLVAHDVHEGREHMNMTDWNALKPDEQIDHIEGIWEMIDDGDMPLWYYQIMHPKSKLSDQDKTAIHNWSESVSSQAHGGEEDSEGGEESSD